MTPDAAVEFLSLGYVLSRQVAEIHIEAARKAGATDAECAEALATWEQMRADDVQTVESGPASDRCLCSHKRHAGLCSITACGCKRFRLDTWTPASARRTPTPTRPLHLDIEEANRRDARDAGELASPPASYDQTKRGHL